MDNFRIVFTFNWRCLRGAFYIMSLEITNAGKNPLWEMILILGSLCIILWFVWLRPKLLNMLVKKVKEE